MLKLHTDSRVQLKVSSVFQNNQQQFGKKHLLDDNPETCWSSESGAPHQLLLDFGRAVLPESIQFMFQGGYVAHPIQVLSSRTTSPYQWEPSFTIYPENNNSMQSFDCSNLTEPIRAFKFIMEGSSDSYGRVVVYHLAILGSES